MFWTYKTILYIKTQLKYYTVTVCTLGWDEITLNLVRTKKLVSFQRDPDVEKFRYRRTGWVNCKRVVLFLTQYKYGFVSMYSIMHVLYSVLYNPLCSGTLWQKRRAWWRVDKTKRHGDALKKQYEACSALPLLQFPLPPPVQLYEAGSQYQMLQCHKERHQVTSNWTLTKRHQVNWPLCNKSNWTINKWH